jgi:hypothetical protein
VRKDYVARSEGSERVVGQILFHNNLLSRELMGPTEDYLNPSQGHLQ